MLSSYIKSKDGLCGGITEKMHYNGDAKYQTVFGGSISMMIYMFMIYYTCRNAYNMGIHHAPYILSLSRGIDFLQDSIATERVPLSETLKVHYEVVDKSFNRYTFEEIEQYLTLTYWQITEYFDESGTK